LRIIDGSERLHMVQRVVFSVREQSSSSPLSYPNTIVDDSDADVPSVPGSLSEEAITLMGAMKFGGSGTVSLQCATTDTRASGLAYNTVITAIGVGTLVTNALTIQ